MNQFKYDGFEHLASHVDPISQALTDLLLGEFEFTSVETTPDTITFTHITSLSSTITITYDISSQSIIEANIFFDMKGHEQIFIETGYDNPTFFLESAYGEMITILKKIRSTPDTSSISLDPLGVSSSFLDSLDVSCETVTDTPDDIENIDSEDGKAKIN